MPKLNNSHSQDEQVAMLVTFKVKPDMRDALKQALVKDLAHSPEEAGYISMNLFSVKDDPNTLLLLERWQNQAAFDQHLAQPHTQAVLKLTETALTSPLEILALRNLSQDCP